MSRLETSSGGESSKMFPLWVRRGTKHIFCCFRLQRISFHRRRWQAKGWNVLNVGCPISHHRGSCIRYSSQSIKYFCWCRKAKSYIPFRFVRTKKIVPKAYLTQWSRRGSSRRLLLHVDFFMFFEFLKCWESGNVK